MTFIESIRRTVGRGKSEPVPETTVALVRPETPAVATGPAIEISPSDPLFAYLQSAPRRRRRRALELDSPALGELGGRRPARRPARQPGRADRRAQPRPAPVGPGLLDRRPQAPRQPRRPGGAGASGSPSSCASRRSRSAARERFEQELEVAPLIQQHFLPRELPRARRLAGGGLLRPGPRGRRRLLRLHPAAGRTGRHRRRRRDRQGRAGRAGHGRARSPSCARRRQRLIEPGAGARAGQRASCAPTCRRRCS